MCSVVTHRNERRFELVFMTAHLGGVEYACVHVCLCVHVFLPSVIYLIVSKWGVGSVAGLSPAPLNFRRGSRTKAIREDKDKSSLDEVF